jgi:hypothetical protein
MLWTELVWPRIGTGEELFESGNEPSGSIKMLRMYGMAAQLAASQLHRVS